MTRRTFGDQRSPAVNNSGPAGRNQGIGSVQRGTAPTASQGWRRAGDGASVGDRSATGASGWRRFSEPVGSSGRSAVRTPQDRPGGGSLRTPQSSQPNLQDGGASRSRDGWNRFGTGAGATSRNLGSSSSSPRSVERGQNYGSNGGSAAPRSASPRYERPGTSAPQTYRGGGQAPVRINPPIVRERAPSYGGGGGSYSRPAPGYGGGNYSRPAPSHSGGGYSRSAPSSGGGGNYSRSAPSGGSYGRSTPSSGGGGRSSSRSSSGGGGESGRGSRSR